MGKSHTHCLIHTHTHTKSFSQKNAGFLSKLVVAEVQEGDLIACLNTATQSVRLTTTQSVRLTTTQSVRLTMSNIIEVATHPDDVTEWHCSLVIETISYGEHTESMRHMLSMESMRQNVIHSLLRA